MKKKIENENENNIKSSCAMKLQKEYDAKITTIPSQLKNRR